MPNKSFSFYHSEKFTVDKSDRLIMEIATSHLAVIVFRETEKAIVAFEMFNFPEEQLVDFPTLYQTVSTDSNILSQPLFSAEVYVNNEFCISVPIYKFSKEIAHDYLNVVFGPSATTVIKFEHLPVEPGIMNVYRINESCLKFLTANFQKISFHHSYSTMIRRVIKKIYVYPAEFISIQFYHTFMIVLVVKDGAFHLIQTFAYQTPEDVLYFLLNITDKLKLFSENLTIQISGMIDLDFQLYRELIKHFKNVMVHNVKNSLLQLDLKEHPQHYFTPFFNLAL